MSHYVIPDREQHLVRLLADIRAAQRDLDRESDRIVSHRMPAISRQIDKTGDETSLITRT